VWEGHSIKTDNDSTYITTLTNANGCDSMISYNVTINPADLIVFDTTLCEGSPNYIWQSNTIETDHNNTYFATLTNSLGCDSTVTYNVTITPVLNLTIDTTICKGEPTFVWNGHTILTNRDSSYIKNLVNTSGCDSIITLNVDIIQGSFAETTETACESFIWTAGDGKTYTTSGVYDYISPSANGCEDTLRLHLIISPDITVNATPVMVNCFGESNGSIDITVAGGIAPFNYLWSGGETVEDLAGLSAGSYSVVGTDSIGCSDSVTVTITQPDVLDITEVHTNIALGETNTGAIDLTVSGGTPGYSYSWSNGATTEDISNLAAGDYTVTVTDANDCSAILAVTITEESAQYSMNCADAIIVGCYADLLAHPPFATFAEYEAGGGTAQSNCGIDESTFHMVGVPQLIDSIYCENILITYSISDSCGNSMECSQLLAVDDNIPPVIDCPTMPDVVNAAIPLPYSSYTEFVTAGGDAKDNCEIVASSFKYAGDSSDGKINPELVTRTYEIADSCGNIGSCTQLITVYVKSEVVISISNISVSCPDDVPAPFTTLEDFIAGGGMAHADKPYKLDTATFKVDADISDGNSCPENITRTYSIRNSNGDLATYDQIIVINDVTPPELRFRERDVECGNEPPVYTTVAMLQNNPRVSKLWDNCELVSVILLDDRSSGECPEILIRTYELFDACGNSVIATEKTNIYDTRPPMKIRGLDDLTADCVVPVPYKTYNEFRIDGHGDYRDYCNDFDLTHLKDSTSDTEPGVIFRIYRLTDVFGNYADEIQKITTNFKVPVFNPINPICQNTAAPALPATDKNGITGVWNPATIETAVAGSFTYTFIPDAGQCAIQKTMVVEISPKIILTEKHENVGFSVQPIGSIDLIVSGGTAPFSYSWSNGAITEDISNLAIGDYTISVTDAADCDATLTVTISGKDAKTTVKPILDTIECITDMPAPYSKLAQFIANGGDAGSDCGIDLSSFAVVKDSSDNNSCPETIYRIYSISDNCGHSLRLLHIIVINDITPPLISCPPNGSAECLSSLPYDFKTIAEFEAAGGKISDNCEIDPTSFTHSSSIVKTINSTTLTTTYSIKDMCGNENSCVHTFLLTDTIPPVANCNPITVYLDSIGNYTLTDKDKKLIAQGSSDNCTSEENLIIDIDVTKFDCEDVEAGVQVNVVVTDEAGNSDVCQATITVVDNLPPVAICQNITIYLDENGMAAIDASQIDNGSYDNCKLDTIYITKDQFDCADVGINQVDLIVIDAATNSDRCTANVTVLDTISPQVISRDISVQLDENGNYTLQTDELVVGTYDICGVDTVFLNKYDLDCSNIGTTYITVTAIDVNGNKGKDVAELTIYGNVAPVVNNDSAITAMNKAIDIDIVANDFDTKTLIDISTLTIMAQPAHGKIEPNLISGEVTYTPDSNFVGVDVVTYSICDDAIPCEPMCGTAEVYIKVLEPNKPPLAVDDNFVTTCASPSGNLLLNDSDPDGDDIQIFTTPVQQPEHGVVTISANGDFDYTADADYIGIDSFAYEITDFGLPNLRDTATVYISVEPDNDCDGIPDLDDIDDDNDGILDIVEGDTEIDSDLDGIPDSYDIDSDDDGILDNIEGQAEGNYIPPTGYDTNHNGWDDAYDPEDGGTPFDPADTDGDSTPDFLDLDSDGDHVYDFIEGHDLNADGVPDVSRIFSDSDHDGLDDIYDTVFGWNDPDDPFNELGSNAPLQDFDHDGIRDWRDINDEDDEYYTIDEDLNNDGDYSNDDLDLDGYPDYLDKTLDCEFFIPEGFSPNGDGVHDFFQILCIQRYPNAILMIFNRNGDLLFEKDHYGNLDYWGSNEDAWWWGTSENKWTMGHTGGLNAGNYVYVLQLGNGRTEKGTVMISY
jgi:gliding motility-associated-like protein